MEKYLTYSKESGFNIIEWDETYSDSYYVLDPISEIDEKIIERVKELL